MEKKRKNGKKMSSNDDIICLKDLREGLPAKVISLEGGHNFRGRMHSMGIIPGSLIKVVESGEGGGPYLVAVSDTRLMLGHGMAEKIFVTPEIKIPPENPAV